MPKITTENLMKEIVKVESELNKLIAMNKSFKNRFIGIELWGAFTLIVLSLFFINYLYF